MKNSILSPTQRLNVERVWSPPKPANCILLPWILAICGGRSLLERYTIKSASLLLLMMMMMMNCFCGMVDQRKVFSLISSRDHCHRSSPLQISDMPRAGFEPAQNLSSGSVEWSCAVVITTKPWRHTPLKTLKACVHYFLSNFYLSPNDSPSKFMKNALYFI